MSLGLDPETQSTASVSGPRIDSNLNGDASEIVFAELPKVRQVRAYFLSKCGGRYRKVVVDIRSIGEKLFAIYG